MDLFLGGHPTAHYNCEAAVFIHRLSLHLSCGYLWWCETLAQSLVLYQASTGDSTESPRQGGREGGVGIRGGKGSAGSGTVYHGGGCTQTNVAQGTRQDHPTGMRSICFGETDDRQPSCTALSISPAPSLTQLLRRPGLVRPLE